MGLPLGSRALTVLRMHVPLPRTALITGVGRRRGIGAAIARGLAADGFDLALNYFEPYDRRVHDESSDVELLAEELRESGRRVVLIPGDLEHPEVPPALMTAARDALGPLGVLGAPPLVRRAQAGEHPRWRHIARHDLRVQSFELVR